MRTVKKQNLHESGLDISAIYQSREESAILGKKIREKIPRESHTGWNEPSGRKDPVHILMESSSGREPTLIPIRYGRMLQSPFTFFRGAAAIMAADLATTA